MMKKNNKTCVCCQKKYTFCLNCSDFDHLPRWMAIYHDENCKKISDAISNYNFNHITKEQAKEILDKCNLKYKENFNNRIKETIDIIYTEDFVDTIDEIVNEENINEDIAITEVEKKDEVIKENDELENNIEETYNSNEQFLECQLNFDEENLEENKNELENYEENNEVITEENTVKTKKRNVKNTKIIENE